MLGDNRRERQRDRQRAGQPIDSTTPWSPMPAATRLELVPCSTCSTVMPAIPIASDALSSAAVHSSRNSSKRDEMSGWNRLPRSLPHINVRGAIRIVIRSRRVGRQRIGDLRARSQLSCAAVMSRLVDHAPARMCHSYAACRSPAASRCSAISAAFWSSCSIAAATRLCNCARSDFSCDSYATARISGCRNAYSGCGSNAVWSMSSAETRSPKAVVDPREPATCLA